MVGVGWSLYINQGRPWDATTYLAAAERLEAGHDLYELAPGDRAVGMDFGGPRVPLMYPPLVAVLWRPLLPLGEAGMYGFMVATIAAVAWAVWRITATPVGSIAVVALFLPLGLLAQVGNIGALILAAAVGGWAVPLVVLAAVKPVALPLAIWALRREPRRALIAAAACAGVSLTAGLDAHLEYLKVVAATSSVGYAVSFAPAILLVACLLALFSRRAAVLGSVLGSPVVTFASIGITAASVLPTARAIDDSPVVASDFAGHSINVIRRGVRKPAGPGSGKR